MTKKITSQQPKLTRPKIHHGQGFALFRVKSSWTNIGGGSWKIKSLSPSCWTKFAERRGCAITRSIPRAATLIGSRQTSVSTGMDCREHLDDGECKHQTQPLGSRCQT